MGREVVEYKQLPLRLREPWDAEILGIRTNDGQVYFGFRQLCEAIGIGYASQTQALKEHPEWYPEHEATVRFRVKTGGGYQEVLCLRKKEAAWWLAHINPKRCKKELQGPLEAYVAALMAAADRLAWGDMTDVPGDALAKQGRPVIGHLDLGLCPRCGANLALVIDEDGTVLRIMEEETT